MIWPSPVASRLPHHGFVSEFTGLEKSTLPGRQNETVKYKVFAGTWNVGGVGPPDDLDLEDWLDTEANSYDIYVLGFQEIVPLNAKNVLGPKKRSASMKWQSLIGDALNNRRTRREDMSGSREGEEAQWQQEQEAFRCVTSKQMVGIFVSVWARSRLHRHVRHPAASRVGAGVLRRLGNKGAVSVRFLLHGTSFCFVCCHLASGGEEGDAMLRNDDAARILSQTSFGGPGVAPAPEELPEKILDHDRVILLGDLNYRIAMDDGEARELVKAKKWRMLLENDELLLELSKGRQFDGWHEGLVAFAPTYKYQPNSDRFYWCAGGADTGREKQHRHRAPAWCDRILWRGKGMRQIRYESCRGYRLSDHRPVRAVFHAVCEVAECIDCYQQASCTKKLLVNDETL
uniref:Inositol polyphosphate-related phosphatase domain-containing protein n=1 Tax=Arundo donax TaxID=35708 RepID=A0A0A9DQL5_ARUDO